MRPLSQLLKAAAMLTAAVLLLASCGASEAPSTQDQLRKAELVVETGEDSIVITVEVADTPQARQAGLAGRATIPADAGMLFVHDGDVESAFHMESTSIPLSVAFLDENGIVLEILDMEPCPAAPCPRYEPSAPYREALELNQGAFARWGVDVGDRVVPDLP